MSTISRSAYLGILAVTLGAASAHAQDANPSVAQLMKAMEAQAKRLADQEKKLATHEQVIEDQRRNLADEKMQFQKLQMQVSTITGKPVAVVNTEANAPKNAQARANKAPDEVGVERKQNQDKPPEIAAVIEEGGVLLQKGKAVITPSVEYMHSTATRVVINGFSIIPALNIGLFDISKVNRDIVTPSVGLRYGITNRIEIEGKVPYVMRRDATSTRPVGVANAPETLTTVDGADLGDVELGAHYQINSGKGGWPFLIGNMRFKTNTGTSPFEVPVLNGVEQELPTGSGFYAVQPSVTAIYPSDPVVYYSNLGYLHSFSENFPLYGDIQPGDSVSGSFGMSLALNDKASFSLGYSHSMVFKTEVNGAAVPNSTELQVGSLDFGYSYNLSDRTNLNFTVSAGVTADAPDIRLVFRTPITYDFSK